MWNPFKSKRARFNQFCVDCKHCTNTQCCDLHIKPDSGYPVDGKWRETRYRDCWLIRDNRFFKCVYTPKEIS